MSLYAVRKRQDRWLVCSGDSAAIAFASYREALEVALSAASVVLARTQRNAHEAETDAAPAREAQQAG